MTLREDQAIFSIKRKLGLSFFIIVLVLLGIWGNQRGANQRSLQMYNWITFLNADTELHQLKILLARLDNKGAKKKSIEESKEVIASFDRYFETLLEGNPGRNIPEVPSEDLRDNVIAARDYWEEQFKKPLENFAETGQINLALSSQYEEFNSFISETNNLNIEISFETIREGYDRRQDVTAFINGIGFVIVLILYMLVSRLSTRISDVATVTKEIARGNTKKRVFVDGNDEITELGRAFNTMLDSLQKTTVSMSFLDNVIQSMSEMLFVLDKNGKIQKVNEQVIDLLGYSQEELKGRFITDIIDTMSNDSADFTDFVDRFIFGNAAGETCVIATKEDLEDITALISGSVLENDEGGLDGYVCCVTDVREQMSLEEQARQSSRLATIGELAAGVGHEINNPLAIAIGVIERLKKELKKDTLDSQELDTIFEKHRASTERIRNIVSGLRTFARTLADDDDIVSVTDATQQTVYLLKEIFDKDGVKIIHEAPEVSYNIKGSVGKIQQVIMNMFTNAKDATEGQEERLITVSYAEEMGKVTLSIADNGQGIPDDIREKIFDAFYTTKKVGKGTGMGLSISSKILKEMKGSLSFDSEVGKGTVFHITLPLTKEQASLKEEENVEVTDLPHRVLVVDDEEDIRDILVDVLESIGITNVVEAENGLKALEFIEKESFDVIFTDMQMPELNGPDLLKRVRELNLNPAPFMVVVTGGIATDFNKKGRGEISELIDGYVMKPFKEQQIREVLAKRQQSGTVLEKAS